MSSARSRTASLLLVLGALAASPAADAQEEPAAQPMTFEAAVKRALERNPTSLQAAAAVRRSEALREQVRAASLPTLTGAAAYTRLDADRVSGGLVLQPQSALNLSATLSVPLVNARSWVQWRQASDQVDVARMNAADLRRVVAVATARAYLGVIAQKRLLDVAGIARDNAQAHYDFTSAQLRGGVGTQLDVARAAQELTTEEVMLQNQRIALARAREALGVLVAGEAPVDVTEWTFGAMPSLADALGESQQRRADVRAHVTAAGAVPSRREDGDLRTDVPG